MTPEMPALIPYNPGDITIPDELKKNILEQLKLVAALKYTLVNEQKRLEMLWKAKHEINAKKYQLNLHTQELQDFVAQAQIAKL